MAVHPSYSGQPFDKAKRRTQILQEMQDTLLGSMQISGGAQMTANVTRALPPPQDIDGIFANLRSEFSRAIVVEGPRVLDRHSVNSEDTYRATRFNHFANAEGIREYAYDDHTGARVKGAVKGNVTVGIGFNMDRAGGRETWAQVFGNSVSFDDVRAGKTALTRPQIQALFDYDVQQFEQVVTKAAGSRPLTQNQRLALVSVAYTSPKRVSGWADIIQSGDDDALRNEILFNSYDKSLPVANGLKTRRYTEAALFANQAEQKEFVPDFKEFRSFTAGDNWKKDQFKSKHYSWTDFRNDRFGDAEISSGLVGLLDNVTDQFGQKLTLTSGYRSPEYNQKASFSGKAGPHTHGYAADIDVSKYSDEQKTQLISLLVANGARGVGHYSNGSIHVDLRPTKGKGPQGLALWWNQNQPYQNGKSWFSAGVNSGLTKRQG